VQVLLIEDDEKIGAFVFKGLRQEGHVVEWTRDGKEGLAAALSNGFDLAIVDVMLPGRDGIEIIRSLRDHKNRLPVIVLSARSSVDDRVAGLEAGADDYLTKPFSFAELNARMTALARRAAEAAAASTTLTVADLVLDVRARRATRAGQAIELAGKEFALLELFMRHADRVLSKTTILDQVWGYSFETQTNVVDVLVSRLRAKIDRDFDDKLIHTIRGVGYVLRRA
jgi:two-component system, OmpR family, response regulator